MAASTPPQHRMSSSTSPSSAVAAATRKPQPSPWTHEETVNLIRAYQEKWYSLKRGQLKASQWEEVAVTVAVRCRSASAASSGELPKTGTQCRHKIEKLRKRYRAEKQRPHPSAWPYFDLMDQMERGPLPISVALPVATLNRQQDFDDDDDDYDDGDDRDDEDYVNSITKKRKFESRVPVDQRLDEFGQMVDGFLRNGKKLGDFEYAEPKSRFRPNPNSNNSRFQKSKLPYAALEEEDDEDDEEEEEIGVERKKSSNHMVGELAVQMREFAEMFMRLERKKMDVMRETERYRMEMENKRMEMILVAQQKTVDMISTAFAAASPSPTPSSSPSPPDKKLQVVNS